MRKILHLALSFILISTVVSCSSKPKDNKKQERALLHLKIGTSHLAKGNYPAALREILHSSKLDPSNPVTFNNLALAYFVRDRYDLAENAIRQALSLAPQYTEAKNNLGRILIEKGLYTEAEGVLNQAVNDLTYNEPWKSHTNLGLALFKNKKFTKAQKQFFISLKYKKDRCQTFNYYGRTLLELQNYPKAKDAFDRAIPLCNIKKFEEPYYYGALAYYRMGNQEQAKARLEELIAKFPEGKMVSQAQALLKMMK